MNTYGSSRQEAIVNKFGKITLFVTSTILATTMCMATPTTSHAGNRGEGNVGMKLLDAIVVRPTSMVWAFVGTGLYLGTTPLSVPTGIADKTAKYLYRKPWKYTAGRPLGAWH